MKKLILMMLISFSSLSLSNTNIEFTGNWNALGERTSNFETYISELRHKYFSKDEFVEVSYDCSQLPLIEFYYLVDMSSELGDFRNIVVKVDDKSFLEL